MNYLSVCSGIEAATVAWHPLGWKPVAFADIEPFPSAVLAHHYPTVPNHGDMSQFNQWPDHAIDLLVGGTPCQAFSIAGLRKGLDDPRGNLTLTFLALARRYQPRWLVWENVPGVLSVKGNPFGQFLAGLAELGYGCAYRVLDAQYFGVAQRRRRVFVVGHFGAWQPAAAVLLEPESLRGDSPPRRQTRQNLAPTISARTHGGGGLGIDAELDGALIPERARALTTSNQRIDAETETLLPVTHSLRAEGFDASEDGFALRANASDSGDKGDGGVNTTLAIAFDPTQITSRTNRSNPQPGEPCHTLAKGAHAPAIAFDCKASGQNGFGVGEIASTLRSMGHNASHQNGGGHQAVAYSELSPTLKRDYGKGYGDGEMDAGGLIGSRMAVRRLTPRECERLQGFPDDYTRIPWRGKPAEICPDGSRYKALGNSMAVPVMHWIGHRIAQVAAIINSKTEVAA